MMTYSTTATGSSAQVLIGLSYSLNVYSDPIIGIGIDIPHSPSVIAFIVSHGYQ